MNDHQVVERAIELIRLKSMGHSSTSDYRVTINFHPDRFTAKGQPLLLAIANDGQLKSQFETGTSNGGLTAFVGGDRWLWEQRVFDGVYDNASSSIRPKYGALNYKYCDTGASPRFGSAYFCLNPNVMKRSTFCYPDSYFVPENFGTDEYVQSLIDLAKVDNLDVLDSYIEAQIHGVVSIESDVVCLVLDPVYKGTRIESEARQLDIDIKWHAGYELNIEEIAQYTNYRGQEIVDIAKEISKNNRINPLLLGVAVNEHGYNAQDVKKVWHCLAKFGYMSHKKQI